MFFLFYSKTISVSDTTIHSVAQTRYLGITLDSFFPLTSTPAITSPVEFPDCLFFYIPASPPSPGDLPTASSPVLALTAAVVSYPDPCLWSPPPIHPPHRMIYLEWDLSNQQLPQPSGWRSKTLAEHEKTPRSASLSSLLAHHSQSCTSHSGNLTSFQLPQWPPLFLTSMPFSYQKPSLTHSLLLVPKCFQVSPITPFFTLACNYQFVSVASHYPSTIFPLHHQHLACHVEAAQQIFTKYNEWIVAEVTCIFK